MSRLQRLLLTEVWRNEDTLATLSDWVRYKAIVRSEMELEQRCVAVSKFSVADQRYECKID